MTNLELCAKHDISYCFFKRVVLFCYNTLKEGRENFENESMDAQAEESIRVARSIISLGGLRHV
ncbi:MAG: hypothetical protein DRQ42_00480 [Gammaproteobacteria bacterium]|nr:MAG: hypothetical protein DRQ42_00480 [Gammaproteobacteria bacterium]